ncbi:MAG: hypothetical protein ACFBWO_17030 [Paracoccaceae bacterium]
MKRTNRKVRGLGSTAPLLGIVSVLALALLIRTAPAEAPPEPSEPAVVSKAGYTLR